MGFEKITFFKELVNQSADWIWTINEKCIFTFVSPRSEEMFGYKPAEMIGKTPFSFMYAGDCDKAAEYFQEYMARREPFTVENIFVNRNGNCVNVETSCMPYFAENNTYQGYCAISRNILRRKQSEEQLINAHKRFLILLDNIDIIIFASTMDEHEVIYINKYGREVLGAALGKKCYQLFHADQTCKNVFCSGSDITAVQPAAVQRWEYEDILTGRRYYCNERTVRWFDGRPVHLIILTDITELKQAEEELARLKVLNAFEKERIRLSRELHDEIGMALTTAKLNLQRLNEFLTSSGTALEKKLGPSIKSIDDSLALVRSKSASLRPPLLKESGLFTAINSLVNEVNQHTNINAELNTRGDRKTLSVETETAIYRCVQEALTNVIRHSAADNVTVSFFWNNSAVLIRISDDGVGFDVNVNNVKEHLGIQGMKERVTLLGGKIKIRSSPGKGTTIDFTVPLEGGPGG
ncbi:MAG: PAS domain S-box protein [Firmicutes bacterium]|nr:PAS domain S-box protein [Bacillota bacterium]